MTRNRDRAEAARMAYVAFAAGDRKAMEDLLTLDYAFFSPPDPGLDREGYFERCRPTPEQDSIRVCPLDRVR